MKLFVYGERDAHLHFKPRFSSLMALGTGIATGYFMQRDNSFIYLPFPLVFTTVTLAFPTKVNQRKVTNTNYIKEDEYLRGHERIARSKRTQRVLQNSIIGMATGFIIGALMNTNEN